MSYVGKKIIIWDWNGTLLDDLDICLSGINVYLKNRNLPPVDKKRYRDIFRFPIENYYRDLGFNFENEAFDSLSKAFLTTYFQKFDQTRLFKNAENVLQKFMLSGFKQYLLSAMDQKSLEWSVNTLGVSKYFEKIEGAPDVLAEGKLSYGKILLQKERLNPEACVLIGDTLHDQEVADGLKISAILISAGHQTAERLKINGNIVVRSLTEAYLLLSGNGLS